MTDYGVTDTGFVIKPLDVLIAEAATNTTTLFGTNIDITDSSPLGKINKTNMAEISILWEEMNRLYLAPYLDSATGINLDKIVEPFGIDRKAAVRSTGIIVFTGTEGTIVSGGSVLGTVGDTPIYFDTASAHEMLDFVTNGGFPSATTDWTAENAAVLASVAGGKDGNCLQVTCGATNNPYAEQIISVTEKHFYNLSTFVKAGTAGTYNVDVYDVTNSAYIYQSGDLTESAGDWSVECAEQIEIPDGCESIAVRLIHRATGGAGTTMLFDTCKLVHVSTVINAIDTGNDGDVAAETIISMSSPIPGITDVINPYAMVDGADIETDVALRMRTKQSIGAGGKATLNAILAAILAVDNVTSVTVEDNDTNVDYTDLYVNSGFDTDTSSWSAGNSAALASVASGQSGNCLRITGTGPDDPYAYQTALVVPGKNYIFSVYIKYGTEATYQVNLYDVTNSAYIYQSGDTEETGGDWSTQIVKPFAAPAGCLSVRVELFQIAPPSTADTIFFDTVILDGLPPHSVRASVSGGTDNDIAQALLDSVAAGITTFGEDSGIGSIDNGQEFERFFARPLPITIYVSATITSDDTYLGDTAVETAIIDYIGGIDANDVVYVGLGAGHDVLFYEVVSAIMNVTGVTNVTSLAMATSSPPTGTIDIPVSATEVSTASITSVVIS